MNLEWTDAQRRLREEAAGLAEAGLNDDLDERDRLGRFHRDGWNRCAEHGIQGLAFPEEVGGGGLDALTVAGVLESLGRTCRDNGLLFSMHAHAWSAAVPILAFGSEEQKRRYLPGLCSGELVGGNAITEPEAGSDAFSLRAAARLDRGCYRLDGHKSFVSNGSIADVLVVYATVDPERGPRGVTAFLVERGAPGLRIGDELDKLGLRTAPASEVVLEDCEVPVEARLGDEGAGAAVFQHAMAWERTCILATAVGTMQRLLDDTIAFARGRRQFGRPIGGFERIADRIVDMKLRLETSRGLLYAAAWQRAQGRSAFLDAALTKLHLSEAWIRCAEDALRIRGGRGYLRGGEVERELRDALGSRIYSGTSEIQRAVVASLLGLDARSPRS